MSPLKVRVCHIAKISKDTNPISKYYQNKTFDNMTHPITLQVYMAASIVSKKLKDPTVRFRRSKKEKNDTSTSIPPKSTSIETYSQKDLHLLRVN